VGYYKYDEGTYTENKELLKGGYMKYIYFIDIKSWEVGCNPGTLKIKRSESTRGARHLWKYLDGLFPGKVSMFKDTSQKSMELLAGPDNF
jgi:hypothetical protein